MGDPHRLLSKPSDGNELERELLASIEHVDPPEHAQAEAWIRVSAQITAAALVSGAPGSAAATTSGAAQTARVATSTGAKGALALHAIGAKAVVALGLAGALGASAVWFHAHRATTPAPPAKPALAIVSSAASSEALAPAPEPTAADSTDSAPAPVEAAKPSVEQPTRDQLSAESSLLTQARAALRKGDARGAQQLLSRLQAQFPKGILGQEREVLAIEVLAARGDAQAAKRRALAFIAAYPESPHSAQLTRFAEAR